MNLSAILSLISTVVSIIFAIILLRRYLTRKGRHLLVWGIALLIYGTGTFAEFYSSQAWNATIFRLWYLCGATLAAAWIGQGTVYLLVRKPNIANILMGILLVGTVIAAVQLFSTQLHEGIFKPEVPLSLQYATNSAKGIVGIMPEGGVRSYSFVFNIYGTLALVGGALYSAYVFWRKRIMPQRVIGNVLIALGGLSPALGGTLARIGTPEFLCVSELIGVIVIFIGFRLATTQQPVEAPLTQSVAA
ncbi:MAG TPA: hypothetical protein VFF59_12345 [Anaerolineae bacterium]|nr:hypothetical protein [Anaerolineae bacterium]